MQEEFTKIFKAICASVPPRYTEYTELNGLTGKTCVENIYAPTNIPHADRSLRDGIAYNSVSADLSKPLVLMSELSASQVYSTELNDNECVFLSTGSYMPLGADCVVPIEDTSINGTLVTVNKKASPWQYVAKRGAQYAKDDIVIAENAMMDYRHAEMLASMRINSVKTVRMPRVAIISTGSEVTDQFGDKSFIMNSNYHGLSAFLKTKGVPYSYLGVVDDSAPLITEIISKALNEFDAIITFGGTAKGKFDLMGDIVEKSLGGTILVNGLRVTPGKTFRLAKVKGKSLFMLPGTPSASLVCEEVFLGVWIACYKGHSFQDYITTCRIMFDIKKRRGYGKLEPCRLQFASPGTDFAGDKRAAGELYAYPVTQMMSNDILKGILMIDEDIEQLNKGDIVRLFITGSNI